MLELAILRQLLWKLLKGGNYSREETIHGNIVLSFPNFKFCEYSVQCFDKTFSFVSFCTVSINVFILLIAIPLATFSESQWGIEDNREDSNCDKTNNKGEVSEQLIKMFLKDLPSVAWANLSSAVFDIATATLFSSWSKMHSLRWT